MSEKDMQTALYDVVNTGYVNGIMIRYMQVALENAGFSNDDISKATASLIRTFDDYRVEDIMP